MSRERFKMYIEKAESREVIKRGEKLEKRISAVRNLLNLINENTQVYKGRFEVEVDSSVWIELHHNRDKLRGVWPIEAYRLNKEYRVWYTPAK